MQIENLSWDTALLSIPVGQCQLASTREWDDTILQAFGLVYISVVPDDEVLNAFLQQKDIYLADEKITFLLDVEKRNSPATDPHVRSYQHSTHDAIVVSIGVKSGIFSRFYRDPHFGKEHFDDLYTTWMLRSIRREIAREVLVLETKEGEIIGVVTLGERKGDAEISIIAVQEGFRGSGAGKKLLDASVHWAKKEGYARLRVVTQLANEPACLFYKGYGFEPLSLVNIYHYWNPDYLPVEQ